MVVCRTYKDPVHPMARIYLADINKDQLENFLIEDLSKGYILGANPFSKRLSNLDYLSLLWSSHNIEVVSNNPLTLIPTDIIKDDSEDEVRDIGIGYRFRLKGTVNEDILLFKLPKGTSDFYLTNGSDHGILIAWHVENSYKYNEDLIRKVFYNVDQSYHYELIQDAYCLVVGEEINLFLDGNIPTGFSELISKSLDDTNLESNYIPTYLSTISKLEHPMDFTNLVINLVNKKSYIPVSRKSSNGNFRSQINLVVGRKYKSRGSEFLCMDATNPIKTDVAGFEHDLRFLQL